MTCPICGSKVKNPDSKGHIRSKRHQEALEQKRPPVTSTVNAVTPQVSSDVIEHRFKVLEAKVTNLANDLSFLKTKVAELAPLSEGYQDDMLERAKKYRMKTGGK